MRTKKTLERGINCIGCGACLALCSALRLVNGHISIDRKKCDRCLKCITENPLYDSCIGRHYRLKILRIYPQYDDELLSYILEGRVGIIRRRLPLREVLTRLMGREPRKVSGNYITIDRGSYKFIIKSKEKND